MTPLFIIGAGALLSFRESSSLGSFARRKTKKNISVFNPLDTSIFDLLRFVGKNDNVRKEDLTRPDTLLLFSPPLPGTQGLVRGRSDMRLLSRLPKNSFSKLIMIPPMPVTKLDQSISDEKAKKCGPQNEFERLMTLKHYQMISLSEEPFIIKENGNGAFLASMEGKVWAGDDFIVHREQDFPHTLPYESPFRTLKMPQEDVNEIVMSDPSLLFGITKALLQEK